MCPNNLENNICGTPAEFAEKYIARVLTFSKVCKENDIEIKVLSMTVDRFLNGFPWNHMSDMQWKGYILEWQSAILPILTKALIQISSEGENLCKGLLSYPGAECKRWGFMLSNAAQVFNGVEGIGITSKDKACICCNNEFRVIWSLKDIEIIRYPWKAKYDNNLPSGGDNPFIPPRGWEKMGVVSRGPNGGFIDKLGREWVRDTERRDHWDLQLDNGTHKNISDGGIEIG
jgi:hypothetical protein